MEKEILKEPMFVEEIIAIIGSGESDKIVAEKLRDYHENDIAQSLEQLSKEDRLHLYDVLGAEWLSEVLTFIDEPDVYLEELGVDKLAAVINEMDSDDAVDLLEDIDEELKEKISPILDEDVKADIQLIHSYDEDEIGSLITTNYISVRKDLSIKQATHELIMQAGENDNISTIYVTVENQVDSQTGNNVTDHGVI